MGRRVWQDFVVRGVTYATVRACADDLGVTQKTVRRALREGRAATLGLGAGKGHAMPVRIAGRDFPSLQAAAAHFGCTASAISKAVDDGDPDRIARSRKGRYHGGLNRPFTMGGLSFSSMRAASLAIGRSDGYVAQVLAKPTRRRVECLRGEFMRLAAQREAAARKGRAA